MTLCRVGPPRTAMYGFRHSGYEIEAILSKSGVEGMKKKATNTAGPMAPKCAARHFSGKTWPAQTATVFKRRHRKGKNPIGAALCSGEESLLAGDFRQIQKGISNACGTACISEAG